MMCDFMHVGLHSSCLARDNIIISA